MRSVLLIDDDAMSRELFALLLEAEGYTVRSSASGDDALRLLQTESFQPEAVLADMQMPGLAGSALAAALQARCPQSVLIGMSASQPSSGPPQGFHAFLLKPFDGTQFTQALQCGTATAIPAQTAATQDLDETIMAALAASMPPSQLSQLYALCLSDARKRAAAMRQSLASGDDAAFRREAHAIKGGASMLGARAIAALARQMEEQGINKDASRRMDEIMEAAERLEGMLVLRFPAE